jgi:hypothetical protein
MFMKLLQREDVLEHRNCHGIFPSPTMLDYKTGYVTDNAVPSR